MSFTFSCKVIENEYKEAELYIQSAVVVDIEDALCVKRITSILERLQNRRDQLHKELTELISLLKYVDKTACLIQYQSNLHIGEITLINLRIREVKTFAENRKKLIKDYLQKEK